MDITLDNYLLCRSDGRYDDGTPVGPGKMTGRLTPGTLDRDYIGAEGVDTEPIGCDRKILHFSATRTYPAEALALAGYLAAFDCPRSGEIKIGGKTLIKKATLKDLAADVDGVTLTLDYQFLGW